MPDRTALVTGGTGGLGAAVVRALLDDGWRVVVPWVAPRELDRAPDHDAVALVQADLLDPESVASAVRSGIAVGRYRLAIRVEDSAVVCGGRAGGASGGGTARWALGGDAGPGCERPIEGRSGCGWRPFGGA